MHINAVVLLLLSLLTGSSALKLKKCSSNIYRLPKNVIPTHYDLTVNVELFRSTFEGEVDIHVKVETINEQLHQHQIAVHASSTLLVDKFEYKDLSTGTNIKVTNICRNKHDVVIISLAKDLVVGSRGVLHISFVGKYGKKNGFYKSSEMTKFRKHQYMAVTHFEPNKARSAFPCFDEPAFKATFKISLIHDKSLTALSNCQQVSEEVIPRPTGNFIKSSFETTPYMSTYLVAYAVGSFDYIEQKILDGRVTVGFYTPKGRSSEAEFTLDIAAKALPLLEDYFGIDFPLKKIDFVSVRMFSASAMENWGLVTMLENIALEDPLSVYFPPIEAARVTINQLAHQWLGNLVTVEWWNDLWLKEGLVRWVEFNMTAVLMPDVNTDAIFVRDCLSYVFKKDMDGLESAVASRNKDTIPDDSLAPIVYEKGSAIINNLQKEYLHPDSFRAALRHHIKTHSYGNARAEDLWHSMELYSKKPVTQFMETWLYQDGHPILSVDVKNGFLSIEQSVFTKKKSELKDSDRRWIIPVTVLVSDGESKQEVISTTLTGQQQVELINLPEWYNPNAASHWLKLNCNATGLYNVEYAKTLLKNLRKPIENKLMSAMDRLDLIINYAAISNGEYILPIKFSKFAQWFEDEDDYVVLGGLSIAIRLYEDKDKRKALKMFFKVFSKYLKRRKLDLPFKRNLFQEEVKLIILSQSMEYREKMRENSLWKRLIS